VVRRCLLHPLVDPASNRSPDRTCSADKPHRRFPTTRRLPVRSLDRLAKTPQVEHNK